MSRIRTGLCFISFVLFTGLAAVAQDLTIDQILKNNETALGGQEALGKIQTIRITTRTTVAGAEMEIKGVTTLKRPNLMRTEIAVQGMNVVAGFDGTNAWMINPQTGPEPQKIDQALVGNGMESNFQWLSGIKATGGVVELVGKEDVKGSPAYKINVVPKTGTSSTYYLDARTFLPVKVVGKLSSMGMDMQVESIPSDYKKVEGIILPHTTEAQVMGQSMQSKMEYEINMPLDDSIFRMPSAQTVK